MVISKGNRESLVSKTELKATMDELKHVVLFFFCMYRPSPWKTPGKPCLCPKFIALVVVVFFLSFLESFGLLS